MKIRQVKESDNPHLSKMIRKVFEEHDAPKNGTVYSDPTTNYLYESFQIEKSVLWVAENNNKILGCCGVYPTAGLPEQCVELVKFYLPKESRGKGIGKILMEKSIDWAGFCSNWRRWLRRTLVRHSFMRRRTSTAINLFSFFNLLWLITYTLRINFQKTLFCLILRCRI